MRPTMLDLFCGGGGAGAGYMRAGFNVVGVDIADHGRNYPGQFIRADALEYLRDNGHRFDAIHASPPCQGYSHAVSSTDSQHSLTRGKNEPRLIAAVRELLQRHRQPWVIENVYGARDHMRADLVLCGCMVGLPVKRVRLFESNISMPLTIHRQDCNGYARRYAAQRGWDWRDMTVTGKGRNAGTSDKWREIMGIDHPMTQAEMAEAIPPAYTEFIGRRFLEVMGVAA